MKVFKVSGTTGFTHTVMDPVCGERDIPVRVSHPVTTDTEKQAKEVFATMYPEGVLTHIELLVDLGTPRVFSPV